MSDIKSNVQHIVNTIQNGLGVNEDGEQISAFDYLSDALDIEYIVNRQGEYLGARVLVAFGGPNIWINTRTKQVEGYWWSDSHVQSYGRDEIGLDDALSELWACR